MNIWPWSELRRLRKQADSLQAQLNDLRERMVPMIVLHERHECELRHHRAEHNRMISQMIEMTHHTPHEYVIQVVKESQRDGAI